MEIVIMKQCPRCNASVTESAKFCSKCGFNIKQYDEENRSDRFCPECGAEISGAFCSECGFKISADNSPAELSAFEHLYVGDGKYVIVGLKDKTAMQYTVPECVMGINDGAFEGCEAIRITLPDSLFTIGARAFKDCKKLLSINIPAELMKIGDEAFFGCEELDIKIPAYVSRVGKNVMGNTLSTNRELEKFLDEVNKTLDEAECLEEELKKEEARRAESAKWNVGCTVTFGTYSAYKDGIYSWSTVRSDPVEWVVLDREGDNALIISKLVLDCVPYSEDDDNVSWKSCSLRKFLNETFFRYAFNADEQARVKTAKLISPCGYGYTEETLDKVFVLSADEAKSYLSAEARLSKPTQYAVNQGADEEYYTGCAWWWLRDAFEYDGKATALCIEGENGNVRDDGLDVDTNFVGVRPVMWVSINI